jgi:hypothetical protein
MAHNCFECVSNTLTHCVDQLFFTSQNDRSTPLTFSVPYPTACSHQVEAVGTCSVFKVSSSGIQALLSHLLVRPVQRSSSMCKVTCDATDKHNT